MQRYVSAHPQSAGNSMWVCLTPHQRQVKVAVSLSLFAVRVLTGGLHCSPLPLPTAASGTRVLMRTRGEPHLGVRNRNVC